MRTKKRFKVPVAVHMLFERHDKLLMLRRMNTGYEDGKWSVPAGHVDKNESITTALIREMKEELGVLPLNYTFEHILHKKDPVDGEERVDLFFSCNRWKGKITRMEPDKNAALKWYTFSNLPVDTVDYVKHAIREIHKRSKFSEFGWTRRE